MESNQIDVLLVDMRLEDGNGADLLPGEPAPGEKPPDSPPVIMMTSHGDEHVAVEAMRRGARDYVVKSGDAFRDMPRVVERVLREWGLVRERESAELKLRAHLIHAAREWRETFDGLPIGILVLDAEGWIRRANAYALREAGQTEPAALLGRRVGAVAKGQPWALLDDVARRALAGESLDPTELSDARGVRTWYVSASRLPATEDSPERLIVNFQDISETNRLRERLRQIQIMAEIGSLVAGVAHEVRTPLFSISATLDAFEARHGLQPGFERYFGVLRSEIRRMTGLMQDLLDFGRASELHRQPTPLAAIVEQGAAACRALAENRGVAIQLDPGPGGTPVELDRQRMAQVAENLISNAVHFSPERGVVRIRVDHPPARDGQPACAELTIRDAGPGFDENDRHRLFDPFFTRRVGGIGLGLSIVRRIVREHGGEVELSNHPEGGALVTVRLPV
jgi:signal transduction histidine kinase